MALASQLTPQVEDPQPRRWTCDEYQQMAELGLFENQRVQLIDGEILKMSPHGKRHAEAITSVTFVLVNIFQKGQVRIQLPLTFADDCSPEPDAAIVDLREQQRSAEHPTTALLVVEVSDKTLAYDRREKASLYARAGIPDYWVLNLLDNKLEIHREPVADADHPFGHRYAKTTILEKKDEVAPLAAPEIPLAVADLLP
ncbi:hypothetical protein Pan216_48130 [Planctomycetes bacterium Pan216]|uniref:Putative restriction endonuclease domain-containing protein n=1 Tax=Kolteria novifilia TaxID=2527975 RepID=A0A518BAC4_9BACT|nr:hypothetical protein Pan216_48130 [Planctomycetes bacterium Pan216]